MTSSPNITLHHLEDSRSQRILWLLEELDLPYTIKTYKRTSNRLAPKELLEVHPLGKSPVITDGSVTLAESGAIIEYIIARYGKGKLDIPDVSSQAWVDNLYFTHYGEGSVQPHLVQRFINNQVKNNAPLFVRPIAKGIFNKIDELILAPNLEKHGKLIEARLTEVEAKGGWFAGLDHPTSADFIMSFTLDIFLQRAPDLVGPKVRAWVKKAQERPAYKRALEKGGEYAYVYKE